MANYNLYNSTSTQKLFFKLTIMVNFTHTVPTHLCITSCIQNSHNASSSM